MFELLDHTADAAVRLRSPTEAALFQDAAAAHVAIVLDLGASAPVGTGLLRPLVLEAEDPEALLVDFLNELIFLFDTERFLTGRVDVEHVRLEKPARLQAKLLGEVHDPARHSARTEVKAATFHDIEIRRTPAGLEAVVVFDL